jgi:hypothetical protein
MKKPRPLASNRAPFSKDEREVRAGILAALDCLPSPSDLLEYSDWWEQLDRPAISRATLKKYRAHLEACRLTVDSIDLRLSALRKLARRDRAEVLAALESSDAPSDLAEYFAWWKQQRRLSFSRVALQNYHAHLKERGLSPAGINQRITALRKYARLAQLRKSDPPAVNVAYLVSPFQFQSLSFDRFEESPEEWSARANADLQPRWKRFLDKQVADLHAWKLTDERIAGGPIAEPKRRRGPGKTGRTSSFEDRCKWAAERLLGREWDDIAVQYLKPQSDRELQNAAATVRQGATDLLRTARLDEFTRKAKPRKRK